MFSDYRVGDLVLVREPDGTTFEGKVSRVGQPWGMTVATSYGRNIPVAFSHALMVEPDPDSPILERWATNGRPVRLEPERVT